MLSHCERTTPVLRLIELSHPPPPKLLALVLNRYSKISPTPLLTAIDTQKLSITRPV